MKQRALLCLAAFFSVMFTPPLMIYGGSCLPSYSEGCPSMECCSPSAPAARISVSAPEPANLPALWEQASLGIIVTAKISRPRLHSFLKISRPIRWIILRIRVP